MPPVKHYSSSEVNQYELSTRLLSLTENNTSYTLTQINGQRIYRKAPHAWNGPEPSRNCEVFIGRIPHDCFEDTLVPLFRQAGELFEFRLMINFSGWNRGYAFAMYTNDAEAANAIRLFNNYMIRPSWQLGVCPSINNCRIFISRIPPSTPSAEIVRLLYALTDEVQEVRIRRSIASCAAIVEYKSHRGAAMARKALVAVAAAAWGSGARPAVDWSLPQSPQLLKQYREIGHWSPERGVELTRAPEEPTSFLSPAAPSYTLEPWSQARRLRMIQEAHRQAANAAEWQSRGVESPSPTSSMQSSHQDMTFQLSLFYSSDSPSHSSGWQSRGVESPSPASTMQSSHQDMTFQPSLFYTSDSPSLSSGWSPRSGMESLSSSMQSLQLGMSLGAGERAVWAPPAPAPAPRAPPAPRHADFNPWTARHPLHEFITHGKEQ